MASTPSSSAGTGFEARPVDAGEREPLIDVLRGSALGGIFISNAYLHFSGSEAVAESGAEVVRIPVLDEVARHLFEYLVAGKAMAIFSFLFGLGLAIQMGRAEARGASVVPVQSRRLGALLLIGLTHLFALWYGDVLAMYASMGFALLLLRNLPDRRLLVWSLALMFGGPLVVLSALRLVPLLASSQEVVQAAAQETRAVQMAIRSRTLAAFASGEYLSVVRANADFYLNLFLSPLTIWYALETLGRFLLGLLAGRRRLLHDVGRHLPLLRRLLVWGLVAGVIGSGAGPLIQYLLGIQVLPRSVAWRVLLPTIRAVGVMGVATVYVAGISLLFQRPWWQRVLTVFAPAGRMALTNYLGQTVLCQLVFYGYGFGLLSRLGPATCLALMSALYCVQVVVSHLWLARFRFGPAEWLWRSLTYGRLQPMRLASAYAGDGAARA